MRKKCTLFIPDNTGLYGSEFHIMVRKNCVLFHIEIAHSPNCSYLGTIIV